MASASHAFDCEIALVKNCSPFLIPDRSYMTFFAVRQATVDADLVNVACIR